MENELKQIAKKVTAKIADPEVVALFEATFFDTFHQTLKVLEDGTIYMVTGDIPAMWLRDSTCQLRPIIPFLKESPKLAELVKGVVARQIQFILLDPYANAYTVAADPERWDQDNPTQGPHVWEQKYEIDSLCFPFQLAYQYWQMTGDNCLFDHDFLTALETVVDLWSREQHHEDQSTYSFIREGAGYLARAGKGSPTAYTGLTWSGFRPSDDPCHYHYLIPSNLFARHVLDLMREILGSLKGKQQGALTKIDKLKQEIEKGIEDFAYIKNEQGQLHYAYEVDGLGNQLLMDDSNMPSLLSLPMLTTISKEDPKYLATRAFVLSPNNPYYYQGKYAKGVGSPHTPKGYVWPIALAVEGLTESSPEAKWQKINMICQTTATKQVHESFDPNEPRDYTREWFSWANAMFCELVLDYCGYPVTVK